MSRTSATTVSCCGQWEVFNRMIKGVFIPVILMFTLAFGTASNRVPTAHARPLAAATPSVSLGLPAEGMIGEDYIFTVSFDNSSTTPGDVGYGPYIDLYLPLSGVDGPTAPAANDGLSFGGASYLGTTVASTVLNCPAGSSVPHPLTGLTITCPPEPAGMTVPFTWQLIVLTLPFGSFTHDQPAVDVNITASLSNYADVDASVDLPILASSGFRYGLDPLDNPATDPAIPGGTTSADFQPTILKLTKVYLGPEDETATGPNYPRRYTLNVDIANGQTINDLDVTDILPGNLQFLSVISSSPAGYTVTSTPLTTLPGGTLTVRFASVTGSTNLVDATVTLEFFVPLYDSTPALILPVFDTCDDALSSDDASTSGSWDTADPRDLDAVVVSDDLPVDHTLGDKCLAIQKNGNILTDTGAAGATPGDTLEYTLNFQISDFAAFNDIIITDVLSDGQHFDATFTPSLLINGNTYDLSAQAMDAANYTVTPHIGNDPDPATDGSTTLVFFVSDEIITRGQNGSLIGGCIPASGTGGSDPDCSTYNDGATTGALTYRAVIQDIFTDTYPSGDPSVDHGDHISNAVVVEGAVLHPHDLSITGFSEADDSAAGFSIVFGPFSKSIYAVNGSTTFTSPVQISPGDDVTYRLKYTLPSTDFEDLVITDYLPLPVFSTSGFTSGFTSSVCGIPAADQACYGPDDSYHTFSGALTPVLSHYDPGNNISFTYGDYDDPGNTASVIDLLFTVKASDAAFADALFLTNQARVTEGTTFNTVNIIDEIIQVQLNQPVLAMRKGIIQTSNPTADTFSPTGVLPTGVAASAPGSGCPRLTSGTVRSNNLGTTFNSNVSNIDAGDMVTFAILIENTGSSAAGAFDVRVRDTLPAGFSIPSGGYNLCVMDGTRAVISTTDVGAGLFDPAGGIELNDPGPTATPAGAIDNGRDSAGNVVISGRNIAIITFDLQLDAAVQPAQVLTNTATLFNFAGKEGGTDHTDTDLTDTATVTIRPASAVSKTVIATNQAHTSGLNVAIGEIVTYRLLLRIPEGITNSAVLVDTLDAGLAFVDCLSVSASSTDLTSSIGNFSNACNDPTNPVITGTDATPANAGRVITFNLGDLTNININNAVDETLTFEYTAVVLNINANSRGRDVNNSARLQWNNGTAQSSNTVSALNVNVVLPNLTVTKTPSPSQGDAGDTITYTLVFSNNSIADVTDAFDAVMGDILGLKLNFVSCIHTVGLAPTTPCAYDSGTRNVSAGWTNFPVGSTSTFQMVVTLANTVYPNETLPNTVSFSATTLPGDYSADQSAYNTFSEERTISVSANGPVTIYNPLLAKSLVTTSESSTVGNQVTIGEIIRYRLVFRMAEGTIPTFVFRDYLPGGQTFLNGGADGDSSARVAFVCTSTPGCITSSTLSGGGLVVAGDETNLDLIVPTFTLPDNAVSASLSSDSDTYNTDSDIYFKFGNLVNSDNDPTFEFVILEFNALVDNNNSATTTNINDAGDARDNYFRWYTSGTQQTGQSNNVTTTVLEPSMSITKDIFASPSPLDSGGSVTYRVIYTNGSGDYVSTAFDTVITDTLPSSLTLSGPVTVTLSGGASGETHSMVGNTLTVNVAQIPKNGSVTIDYIALINDTALAGGNIDNTARNTYTSLPGLTGSACTPASAPYLSCVPGASGSATGERNGNGSGQNDYLGSDPTSMTLTNPQINKLAPTPVRYTIGETITYSLEITLPEGTTQNLVVVDDLPAGLGYVSSSINTTGYQGSLPAYTITAPGGSGVDVTYTFTGNAVTLGDNDTGNNTFSLQVIARVLNIPGNQNNTILTNNALLRFTDPETGVTTLNAPSRDITVIEPVLGSVKSLVGLTPDPAIIGGTVTYRITLSHQAASQATAYDTQVIDTLPAELSLGTVNITLNGTAAGSHDNSIGNTLNVIIDSIPNDGSSVVIEYTASINASITPQTTNTQNTSWSTLPGASSYERENGDGLLDGGGLNDYELTNSVLLTIPMDFGDLLDLYQTQLSSNGARHILGNLHMGSTFDAENDGQPGLYANNDGADEDGIATTGGEFWTPGNTVHLVVTVNRAGGYLVAWFDWNDNGAFDASEMVDFGSLPMGSSTLNLTIPSSPTYETGRTLHVRYRLYDGAPSAPTWYGTVSNGEVEDYRLAFSPTAVKLVSFNASPRVYGNFWIMVGIAFIALACFGLLKYLRARVDV